MMMMIEHEEGVDLCKDQSGIITKGKRTKRQRTSSPQLTLALTSSSEESGGRYLASSSSPITTISSESTEEDEDMANCLILLAQGQSQSRRTPAPRLGPTGYECKTCNRSFSSFQALGGHRASHKKPKFEEKNAGLKFSGNCGVQLQPPQFSITTAAAAASVGGLSLRIGKSSKVHECSICSAEFPSGQALGGHMRRHRSIAGTMTAAGVGTSGAVLQGLRKERDFLQLDLNLPAPEEGLKFSFGSKEKLLVFSASNSLVNCHY